MENEEKSLIPVMLFPKNAIFEQDLDQIFEECTEFVACRAFGYSAMSRTTMVRDQ